MNGEQSIIDAINELVDEQLLQEASGYDHNINQPKCRCGAEWHGLPAHGCRGTGIHGPINDGPPWIIDSLSATMSQVQSIRDYLRSESTRFARSVIPDDALTITIGESA